MKIERFFLADTDRYHFDFDRCPARTGWAQVDRDEDAWYYGAWAHPDALMVYTYAEGDVCRVTCDTPEELENYLLEMDVWELDQGRSGIRIDPGLRDENINRWRRYRALYHTLGWEVAA